MLKVVTLLQLLLMWFTLASVIPSRLFENGKGSFPNMLLVKVYVQSKHMQKQNVSKSLSVFQKSFQIIKIILVYLLIMLTLHKYNSKFIKQIIHNLQYCVVHIDLSSILRRTRMNFLTF